MFNLGDILIYLRMKDEATGVAMAANANITAAITKMSTSVAHQMVTFGRGMQEGGMLLTAGLTVPITLAAKSVIEFGSTFETEMMHVTTLAGTTRQEVDSLKQSVIDLGPAVGIGPSELSKGLFVLESFGMRGAVAMDTLTIAAKMSALGMGTAEETARGLTGAIFSYRDQNLSAAEAGNILAKAIALGNVKINELVPALATIGPVAAEMGIKFEDVAASMATFLHAGVNAAVASTGLRAAINSLLKDTHTTEVGFHMLSEALGDSNISLANTRKEITDQGFTTAMVNLAKHLNDAGEAGKSAAAKIFPNIRGLVEFLGVYVQNAEMVIDINGKMRNKQDIIAEGMVELEKTWNFKVASMKSSLEGLAISLFNLPPAVQVVTVSIGTLLAGMGPGLLIAGQWLMMINNLKLGLAGAFGSGLITFLMNPWFLGAAAAFIAIAAAIAYFSTREKESADSIKLVETSYRNQIETLEKLSRQMEDNKTTTEQYHAIAQQVLLMSPQYVSSIGGETVERKKLNEAIVGTIDLMKKLKDQQDIVLVGAIASLKEQIAAAEGQLAATLQNKGNPKVDREGNITGYDSKLSPETVLKLSTDIKKNLDNLRSELGKLELGKDIDLFNGVKTKSEKELKDMHDSLTKDYAQMLKDIASLSEENKQDIEIAGKISSERQLEVAKSFGLTAESLRLYESQLKSANKELKITNALDEEGSKNAAKYASDLKAVTDRLADQGVVLDKFFVAEANMDSASNAAKKMIEYGVSLSTVNELTHVNINTLAGWKKEFEATAVAQKKFAADTAKSIEDVNNLNADTATIQLEATNNIYSVKEAKAGEAFTKELQNLNKMSLTWEQYYAHLEALVRNTSAKIDEINREMMNHWQTIMQKASGPITAILKLTEDAWPAIIKREKELTAQHQLMLSSLSELSKTFSTLARITSDGWLDTVAKSASSAVTGFKELQKNTDNLTKAFFEWNKPLGHTKDNLIAITSSAFAATVAFVGLVEEAYKFVDAIDKAMQKSAHAKDISAVLKTVGTDFSNLTNSVVLSSSVMTRAGGEVFQFSNDLAESILKSYNTLRIFYLNAAEGMREHASEALHLTQIIEELGGVSDRNLGQIQSRMSDLVELIRRTGSTSQIGVASIKELSSTIKLMGDYFEGHGGIWNQTFLDLINKSKELKLNLKEVNDLIAGQQSNLTSATNGVTAAIGAEATAWMNRSKAVDEATHAYQDFVDSAVLLRAQEAYDKAVKNGDTPGKIALALFKLNEAKEKDIELTKAMADAESNATKAATVTQDEFDRLSRIALNSFNTLVSSGKDIVSAMDDIGPSIDNLILASKAFGFEGNSAFNELKRWRDLTVINAPLLKQIGSLNGILIATANLGGLTANSFKDIEDQGKSTYESLLAAFTPLNATQEEADKARIEAETAMKPLLESIIKLHKDKGFAIDDETQKLIDQAKKDGVITEDQISTNDILMIGFSAMITALGGDLPEAFRKFGNAGKTEADKVTEAINKIPKDFDINAHYSVDTPGEDSHGPAIPQAAGGDWLVTKPTLFLAGEAGAERATFTPVGKSRDNNGGGGTAIINIDGRMFAEVIVPHIPGVVKRYGLNR